MDVAGKPLQPSHPLLAVRLQGFDVQLSSKHHSAVSSLVSLPICNLVYWTCLVWHFCQQCTSQLDVHREDHLVALIVEL